MTDLSIEAQSESTEKKQRTQRTPKSQPTGQKIVFKDHRSFRHDLFKLELATMKKNVSWKVHEPMIENVEHVHFYHSHSSQGKPLKTCNSVGGHFHEVTIEIDQDGNVKATCSPPIQEKEIILKHGVRKEIQPIKFFDEKSQKTIVDDHVHAVTYLHSEQLSPEKLRMNQTQDYDKFSRLNSNG